MIAACGGSAGDSPPSVSPDAGTTFTDGGAADATPERVRIIKVTPADAEKHVAPLAKIVLLLNGRVDPSSVSTTSVRLFAPNASQPVPASVTWDPNALTITLVPQSPLGERSCGPMTAPYLDNEYRVVTSSLRAFDGVPIDDVATKFTTLRHAVVADTSFKGGSLVPSYPAAVRNTLDSEGRIQRSIQYDAGPNGIAGDSDDVVSRHDDFSYGADGMRVVSYTAPGADGTWLTADDAVGYYWALPPAPTDRWRQVFYGAGADGKWLTPDDVVTSAEEWTLAPDGSRLLDARGYTPGADGVPFTSDDVTTFRRTATWNATTGQLVEYSSAGPDGVWMTADDVVNHVWSYTLDGRGRLATVLLMSKGPDGVWLTPDDAPTFATQCTSRSDGVDTGQDQFDAPGPDGRWLTSDDHRRLYIVYASEPSGATSGFTAFDAVGADGQWRTPDDHVGERITFDTSN